MPAGKLPPLLPPSWKIRDTSAGWVLRVQQSVKQGPLFKVQPVEPLSLSAALNCTWCGAPAWLFFVWLWTCWRSQWKCRWMCGGDCFSQVTVKPASNHRRLFSMKKNGGHSETRGCSSSWLCLHPQWLHPALHSFYVVAHSSRPVGG